MPKICKAQVMCCCDVAKYFCSLCKKFKIICKKSQKSDTNCANFVLCDFVKKVFIEYKKVL